MDKLKKILLIEHRDEFKAIYGLNLSVYLGAKVILAETKSKAFDLMKEHQVQLIFVDNEAYTTDMANDLFAILDKKRMEIPLYVIGKTIAPKKFIHNFDSNLELRHILGPLAERFDITAKSMATRDVGPYYPLNLEFIIPGWYCTQKVYIRDNNQFIVEFLEKDIITYHRLMRLRDAGFKNLYVESETRVKFVNSLTSEIFAKLNDPNLRPEDRVHVTAKAYQMVMEQARRIGIGQSTLELANACMDSMRTIVGVFPSIHNLLADLLKDSSSYKYRHSLLAHYIGFHLLKKVNWGSREEQDKLSFLCFFHDITLPDDDMSKIKSDKEILQSDYSEEEKDLILNHAAHACKLISKIKKIPFGIDTIIKQHHGSKTGKTLSKISPEISPLATLFVLAEEWAHQVIDAAERDERIDKEKIIAQIAVKYDLPNFKKIIPHLHTLNI